VRSLARCLLVICCPAALVCLSLPEPASAESARERLAATTLQDEQLTVQERGKRLQEIRAEQAALGSHAGNLPTARMQARVNTALGELVDAEIDLEAERQEVYDLAQRLSDAQVQAFNRPLEAALASGRVIPVDAAELRRALEWELDEQAIRSMVQAFAHSARRVPHARATQVRGAAAAPGAGEAALAPETAQECQDP
jgi:hypothetical protein